MLEPKRNSCSQLSITPEITLYHTGPSLDKGPYPALFYFALSGEDSLCQDPFNQIVQFLSDAPIRIFSLTLPAHEADLPPTNALNVWAEDIRKGVDVIERFTDQALRAVSYVTEQNIVNDKLSVAGLSRGCFMAAHLAAREPKFRFLLHFAPMTDLMHLKEFHEMAENPTLQKNQLDHLIDSLYDRHIRIYIGNRDVRVGTKKCYSFVEKLVEKAFQERIRSPQIELILSPSIGHQGHGTGPETFKKGADWIAENLLH